MARTPAKKGASRKRTASAGRKGSSAKKPAAVKRGTPQTSLRGPRRPAAIPAREWKELAPSTRKRYAGYLAKHPEITSWNTAARQRARGHRAGEAAERRSKLDQRIEAFAERQAYRGADYPTTRDADAIAADIRAKIKQHGEAAFRNLERRINALNARFRQHGQPHAGSRFSLGIDLSELADEFDMPESELFYH